MSSQSDDNQGVVFGILGAVVVFAVALAVGFGLGKKAPKPAPEPEAVVMVAEALTDGASVSVDNGVVKFYFASGSAEVAAEGGNALVDVLGAVADGKQVVLSGFHDATGDAALNAELAKQRALAVRDLLVGMGVAPERIELKKPEEALADGAPAEARRVEVSVQ